MKIPKIRRRAKNEKNKLMMFTISSGIKEITLDDVLCPSQRYANIK